MAQGPHTFLFGASLAQGLSHIALHAHVESNPKPFCCRTMIISGVRRHDALIVLQATCLG